MKTPISNSKHIRKNDLYVYPSITTVVVIFLMLFCQTAHSQIVLSGDALLYNETPEKVAPASTNNSEGTFYVSKDASVTNFDQLIEDNPNVNFVIEEKLPSQSNKIEKQKIAKETEKVAIPKPSSKKYFNPVEINFTIQNLDSDGHLIATKKRNFSLTIVPNFNSKIKAAILSDDLYSSDFSLKSVRSTVGFSQDKYDFQDLLSHLTRPPPSFS